MPDQFLFMLLNLSPDDDDLLVQYGESYVKPTLVRPNQVIREPVEPAVRFPEEDVPALHDIQRRHERFTSTRA